MLAVGSGRDLTLSQVLPRVVFVVAVRNNAALLGRCLRSVAGQTYSAIRCVVIDDASDDGTAAVAHRWSTERPDRFTARVVGRRRGKMANFFDGISGLDPHDAVVELDGDDRLLSTDAASDLARLHMRLDLVWTQHRVARHKWPTWSHFPSTDLPPAYRHRPDLPRLRWSRTWHPSHLRSFKAWAFHQIDPEDLKLDGEWVQASADVAYFTPLVEMTPPSLRYFYDRELAIYNITAQNEKFHDTETSPPQVRQSFVTEQLYARPPYRSRPALLWIGVINSANRDAIQRAWTDEINKNPATRFLLASEVPMQESWHPRVQIIAQYTIANANAPPAERAETALRWLESYAAEQMCSAAERTPPPPGLSLRLLL